MRPRGFEPRAPRLPAVALGPRARHRGDAATALTNPGAIAIQRAFPLRLWEALALTRCRSRIMIERCDVSQTASLALTLALAPVLLQATATARSDSPGRALENGCGKKVVFLVWPKGHPAIPRIAEFPEIRNPHIELYRGFSSGYDVNAAGAYVSRGQAAAWHPPRRFLHRLHQLRRAGQQGNRAKAKRDDHPRDSAQVHPAGIARHRCRVPGRRRRRPLRPLRDASRRTGTRHEVERSPDHHFRALRSHRPSQTLIESSPRSSGSPRPDRVREQACRLHCLVHAGIEVEARSARARSTFAVALVPGRRRLRAEASLALGR